MIIFLIHKQAKNDLNIKHREKNKNQKLNVISTAFMSPLLLLDKCHFTCWFELFLDTDHYYWMKYIMLIMIYPMKYNVQRRSSSSDSEYYENQSSIVIFFDKNPQDLHVQKSFSAKLFADFYTGWFTLTWWACFIFKILAKIFEISI